MPQPRAQVSTLSTSRHRARNRSGTARLLSRVHRQGRQNGRGRSAAPRYRRPQRGPPLKLAPGECRTLPPRRGGAEGDVPRSTIPTKASHPKGIHPIRPASGQPLPEGPRPCLGCIMAAATQDITATASVTATMANHMSTSMIDDEQTRRVAVACLGQKAAESRHAAAPDLPWRCACPRPRAACGPADTELAKIV